MKTIPLALTAFLLLYSLQPLVADETEAAAPKEVTLDLGSTKVIAIMPAGVSNVMPDRIDHPSAYYGTKGNPTAAHEIYSIRIVSPDEKMRDKLLDEKTGQLKDFTSVGQFMSGLAKSKTENYEVIPHSGELPESVQEGSPTDRYLWLSSSIKPDPNAPVEKAAPKKEMLWRILLVNGQVIMAEREMSPAFVEESKIDPRNDQEWEYLKSIQVVTAEPASHSSHNESERDTIR